MTFPKLFRVAVLFGAFGCATDVVYSKAPATFSGVISWPTETERGRKLVPDADTPRVKRCHGTWCELVKVRIRFADAPEINQPYGREALAYAKEHWQGKVVICSVRGDSYGRPVVDIVDKDGNDLATDLVSHGYAMVDPRYPSKALSAAQDKASCDDLGIWSGDENPIEPWTWRRDTKATLILQRKK